MPPGGEITGDDFDQGVPGIERADFVGPGGPYAAAHAHVPPDRAVGDDQGALTAYGAEAPIVGDSIAADRGIVQAERAGTVVVQGTARPIGVVGSERAGGDR